MRQLHFTTFFAILSKILASTIHHDSADVEETYSIPRDFTASQEQKTDEEVPTPTVNPVATSIGMYTN